MFQATNQSHQPDGVLYTLIILILDEILGHPISTYINMWGHQKWKDLQTMMAERLILKLLGDAKFLGTGGQPL